MPGKNQHIIHSLKYDIQFHRSKANKQEENISRWHLERFMHVLEECLNQAAPGNDYLVAEKLELDLGNIPKAAAEEVFSARLRELLSEKLADLSTKDLPPAGDDKKLIPPGDTGDDEAYGRQSPEEHRISLLLGFLRSGHFNWQAGRGSSAIQIFDQLLAGHNERLFDALAEEFKSHPHSLIRFLLQMKATQRKAFYDARLPALREELDKAGLVMATLSVRSGATPALAYLFLVRVKALIIRNALSGKTLKSLEEWIGKEKESLKKLIPGGMVSLPPGARPFETSASDTPVLKLILELIRETLLPEENTKTSSASPSGHKHPDKDDRKAKPSEKAVNEDKDIPFPEVKESLFPKEDDHPAGPDEELEKGLMAEHGGLVLLHPYLAKLFEELDLLEGDSFKGMLAQYEAVFALHYLAGGDQPVEEQQLLIPRILCGMQTDLPLPSAFPLREKTMKECRKLLDAVIKNWSALGSTSIKGLQDSFLQRECLVRKTDENYEFLFERRGMDVLIDRIPWGISMLKLKWTPYLINVSW